MFALKSLSFAVTTLICSLWLTFPAIAGTAPWIDAGEDQIVSLNQPALLSAVVFDQEPPYLSIGWSKVSGPGEVEFSSQRSAITEAVFSAPGEYQLMLGGYDGSVAYDFVFVTVIR